MKGSYEFQIESDAANGSVYNYKVVKNKSDGTMASFGIHSSGEDESQIWVKWESGEAPSFYHRTTSSSSATLSYKVKFITV